MSFWVAVAALLAEPGRQAGQTLQTGLWWAEQGLEVGAE